MGRYNNPVNTEPLPINPTGFCCIKCGYDVSGSAVGGLCPECGKSVGESLRAVQFAEKSCSKSTASMIIGILSLVTCAAYGPLVLGPIAIVLYYLAKKEMAVGGYSKSSHTMARAGLIIGIVSIILFIAMSIFGYFMMMNM